MKDCVLCGKEAKYKCKFCENETCSLGCFKQHREECGLNPHNKLEASNNKKVDIAQPTQQSTTQPVTDSSIQSPVQPEHQENVGKVIDNPESDDGLKETLNAESADGLKESMETQIEEKTEDDGEDEETESEDGELQDETDGTDGLQELERLNTPEMRELLKDPLIQVALERIVQDPSQLSRLQASTQFKHFTTLVEKIINS